MAYLLDKGPEALDKVNNAGLSPHQHHTPAPNPEAIENELIDRKEVVEPLLNSGVDVSSASGSSGAALHAVE